MPQYSQASKDRLATVDYRLQLIFYKIIPYYDVTIIEGRRDEQRQNELYREGATKVQYPDSNHNPDPASNIPQSQQLVKAVDVAPYPVNFAEDLEGEAKRKEIARFYYLAGIVEAVANDIGVSVRWGGDWDSDHDYRDQDFDDLVHYEIE